MLPGLLPGTYVIEVTGDGAPDSTEPITLQVGETASLDLALGTAVAHGADHRRRATAST